MIYRLRYCNKDGVEARVDIQKGLATPVINVEGTERPFILSYNNDKGDKSGMFLSSSADIEIYETPDFNINNLKTSNETELSVTHYINNVISWQGFIIPDFFSIEVRNNPVITMTASDRLGTLKNVTLDDLPTMVNIRELTLTCLSKTGLSLPLKTIADFSNDGTVNAFFSYYVDSQRIKDIKGRSISCYDILSSILIASNSKLVQRAGEWVIINKLQHEIGSGKIYSSLSSFTNYLENIYNFEEVSVGARRTIMPVAGSVGIYHEHGGRKLHPANYDFSLDLSGWNSVNGFVATIEDRHITGFLGGTPLFDPERTVKKYLLNYNNWIDNTNNLNTAPYISTDPIQINSPRADRVEVTVDISSTMAEKLSSNTAISFLRYAVILTNGVKTYTLTKAGIFEILDPENISGHSLLLRGGQQPPLLLASPAFSNSDSFKGLFEVGEDDDVNNYSATIRVYGSGDQYVTVNYALIKFSDVSELPKGTMYKTEQGNVFTKAYDIETSIFGDYLLSGLDGYFYRYPNDDTSSIYKDVNTLSSPIWTTPSIPNETSELPLLHHSMRQMRRMFSVAHDLLSAEIEVSNFDPLAIFVACGKRYTVVSAQFDFFKSNLSVELEEVAFQSANVRDFIYSYFGDGESGIKSIGGISGGAGGGGSTGGGLTPEQLEILSWWKKDPDNPNTIFTEMNAYSKLELSAYGAGDGGGSGGDFNRLDVWADYDSSKAGWVLSALLGNDLNTRVTAIDGRVTDLENSAGGGSVTSVGISVPTGLSVSNSPITSSGVIAIGLQTGYSIPTTAKQEQWDTAFTNNHTHSNKTVLDGITSALVSNWNTAYSNRHTHSNKTVLDGITSTLVSNWDTAYSNRHTHSNKTQLDLITQSNIDVLAKLSIVNGNLQIDGNAYATGELSAYGAGSGGGGGGGIIETVYGYSNLGQTFNNSILTDTFNAYTINQINTRLVSVENGSATTVNTIGTGNAITSISKSGTVITATKGATVFTKNTAFNKNFGTTAGTVAQGNDSRINNGQTAFGWGDHASAGYALNSALSNYLPLSGGAMSGTITSTIGGTTALLHKASGTGTALARIGAASYDKGIGVSNTGELIFGDWSVVSSLSTAWNKVYHTGNFNPASYLPLSGGTLTGNLTAPSFIGSLSGNASTATKLQTARTIAGVSFDGTANIAIPFANLSSKPTTLAGYGITNAYTKTEVDTALALKLNKSVFDDLFEKVEVSTGVFAIKAKYSFYSTGEVSAYGIGSGGSSGGSYERLDAWVDYDSTKSGWVLSALLGVDLNTRVGNLEGGSALTVNTTGTGNAITSISKAGTVITATKGATFSLSNHLHSTSDITSGIFAIARIPTGTTGTTVALGNHLHSGVYEPVFSKNTAFNKNFGAVAGTVAEGNDSRIINGQTAFGWGNHSGLYLPLTGGTMANTNLVTNLNADLLDGIDSAYFKKGVGLGSYYRDVVNVSSHTTVYEILIKTKIPFISSSQMPLIHLEGYAYGAASPIDLRVAFYIYNSSFANLGCTSTCPWKPTIKMFTYLDGTTRYVGIALIQNIYYPQFTVNYIDVWGGSSGVISRNYSEGWSYQVNTVASPTIVPTDNLTIVPYKPIANDITGNADSATTATKLGTATVGSTQLPFYLNAGTATAITQANLRIGLFGATAIGSSTQPVHIAANGIATACTSFGGVTGIGTASPLMDGTVAVGTSTLAARQDHRHPVDTSRAAVGQTMYIGTTAVAINRASATLNLTGIGTLAMGGALSGATTIAASTSVTTPKVIFNAAGWSMEQVGSELQMKYNNVLKMRFTSTGSIIATEEITAFG